MEMLLANGPWKFYQMGQGPLNIPRKKTLASIVYGKSKAARQPEDGYALPSCGNKALWAELAVLIGHCLSMRRPNKHIYYAIILSGLFCFIVLAVILFQNFSVNCFQQSAAGPICRADRLGAMPPLEN